VISIVIDEDDEDDEGSDSGPPSRYSSSGRKFMWILKNIILATAGRFR